MGTARADTQNKQIKSVSTKNIQISTPSDTSEELREACSSHIDSVGPHREFEETLQALEWSSSEE